MQLHLRFGNLDLVDFVLAAAVVPGSRARRRCMRRRVARLGLQVEIDAERWCHCRRAAVIEAVVDAGAAMSDTGTRVSGAAAVQHVMSVWVTAPAVRDSGAVDHRMALTVARRVSQHAAAAATVAQLRVVEVLLPRENHQAIRHCRARLTFLIPTVPTFVRPC